MLLLRVIAVQAAGRQIVAGKSPRDDQRRMLKSSAVAPPTTISLGSDDWSAQRRTSFRRDDVGTQSDVNVFAGERSSRQQSVKVDQPPGGKQTYKFGESSFVVFPHPV